MKNLPSAENLSRSPLVGREEFAAGGYPLEKMDFHLLKLEDQASPRLALKGLKNLELTSGSAESAYANGKPSSFKVIWKR